MIDDFNDVSSGSEVVVPMINNSLETIKPNTDKWKPKKHQGTFNSVLTDYDDMGAFYKDLPSNISLRRMESIMKNEGVRKVVYLDSEKKPTVGVGHLVTKDTFKRYPDIDFSKPLSAENTRRIFLDDLKNKEKELKRFSKNHSIDLSKLSEHQNDALFEMIYQLGETGLGNFKGTISKIRTAINNPSYEAWEAVKKEALNSRWARQTPNRAKTVTDMFLNMNSGPRKLTQFEKDNLVKD